MASQSDQLIEERRKKIAEDRKKVIRYNILLSLFIIFIIAGLIGTIFYYRKLQQSNLKLAVSQRSESLAKDSLLKTTGALQRSKDSLQAAKTILANEKSRNDSLLVEVSKKCPQNIQGLQTAVTSITTSRKTARESAREGYEKLKNYDFQGAMDAFNRSEKAYNGYRDSYDIWFLLWSNRANLNSADVQKQLMEKIIKNFNSLKILAPSDIRQNQ
jgi:hypothetical protein